MKYEDLVEYFESYVDEYKPYKDDKLYTNIVKFLHSYYLKHSYETIPSAFKTAFEGQTIPPEFYDVLLLSNGFPKSLLEKLKFNDKFILLNSLMDYNHYKGTIHCLRKVVSTFDDDFNVYELFLDYRDTSPNGAGTYDWVFIPYSVYTDPNLKEEKLDNFFSFDEIYYGSDHFFVNREQLDDLKSRNELLLPMKTNLILLDQTTIERTSPLLSLFFIITFNRFRNERMILYFEDGQYSLNLQKLYELWYYILFKWYGKDVEFTAPSLGILYTLDNPISLDYILEDIDLIQEEYNNLSLITEDAGEKLRLFYKEKIEDVFKQFQRSPITYTQDEWTKIFEDNLGKVLIEYVDGRMENIEVGSDISIETNKLLDEIYNSLITWSVTNDNPDVKNYFHYFLDMLPFLIIQPEKTGTFRVMNFLKPFHVELTGQGRIIYEINDKFNSVLADNKFSFLLEMSKATLNTTSHQLMQKVIRPHYDTQAMINDFYYIINQYLEMVVPILSEFEPTVIDRKNTVVEQSYRETHSLTQPLWEYDTENIMSKGDFISSTWGATEVEEQLYEFPAKMIVPEGTVFELREESKKQYIASPFMYSFHTIDDSSSITKQNIKEIIDEIKYYLIFNLTSIKYTMHHNSHRYPQKIKQLKQYDTLYTFIQSDYITKFFGESELTQQFKQYFNSNTYKVLFQKLDDNAIPSTIMPPKIENFLAHIEDTSTTEQFGEHGILLDSMLFNLSPNLHTDDELFNFVYDFNFDLNDPIRFDHLSIIDGNASKVINPEDILVNTLSIYNFSPEIVKHSISQIRDRYSAEFSPGPIFSNIHMISFADTTGMDNRLLLEAMELYSFKITDPIDDFVEFVDVYAFSFPPEGQSVFYNIIDDVVTAHRDSIELSQDYIYQFDNSISKFTIREMSHKYHYNINFKSNTIYIGLEWLTGERIFEDFNIDYSFDIGTDWAFLTDVDTIYDFNFNLTDPTRFDNLSIISQNNIETQEFSTLELDINYIFNIETDWTFLTDIDIIYDFNFSQNYIDDDNYDIIDTVHTVHSDSSNFNNIEYSKLFEIKESRVSTEFIEGSYSFDLDDKIYQSFDNAHLYDIVPMQYGSSKFEIENDEKIFETIMPFNSVYDYWEEAYQIIHQRAYHDGLPVRDNHLLKHLFYEKQIIEDFYNILPLKYSHIIDTQISHRLNPSILFGYSLKEHVIDFYSLINKQFDFNNITINADNDKLTFIRHFKSDIEFEENVILTTGINAIYDNMHIFIAHRAFGFNPKTELSIDSSIKLFKQNYQKGSVQDYWYFMVFDWNAIYSSIGLDIKYHRQFRQGWGDEILISHYNPFDHNYKDLTTKPIISHHPDWAELHPHPILIGEELVFNMQPQFFDVDINYGWDFQFDFPETYVNMNHVFSHRFPDLVISWMEISDSGEDLTFKQYKEEEIDILYVSDFNDDLFRVDNIQISNQYLSDISKEDFDNFRLVSNGSPIPVQYGPAILDITYGYRFIDPSRFKMFYEIESNYNFITKLYPQESSMVVETIGQAKNRFIDDLFIDDYFLPINSGFLRLSVFDVSSNSIIEVIPEAKYDEVTISIIGGPLHGERSASESFHEFNFTEYFFGKTKYNNITHDKTFETVGVISSQLNMLSDSISKLNSNFIDLKYDVFDNFNLINQMKEQTINVFSNKYNKYIESKKDINFGIDDTSKTEWTTTNIQKDLLDILYDFDFGDYVFKHNMEMDIDEQIHLISPYMSMDNQSYINASDLGIMQFKDEPIDILYDYGQIGYAPEIVENIQEYETGAEFIISGNEENQEQMEISHNFNTIKI